ncbi:hypothetical protein M5K25_007231 [Dendrobium thyrsiflorum]|uniref:Uncharacterized protein n=1 Tax=Dendrobium thyrsiflorum TaxID=117978 RepID=A0ABD0VKB8_DENTH
MVRRRPCVEYSDAPELIVSEIRIGYHRCCGSCNSPLLLENMKSIFLEKLSLLDDAMETESTDNNLSPLIKAQAMEREVLAVDSEFKQVLQSNSCHLIQLTYHTSTNGHPLNRFFWENRKSFVDAMENGNNLQAKILLMYRGNYLGNITKFVFATYRPESDSIMQK